MASKSTNWQVGDRVERWEGNDTWPHVNKVFNVYTGHYPNMSFSTPLEAPHQRARGYPESAGFLRRGNPQLTWFEATYDVMAHKGGIPQKCVYPNLATPMKDHKRKCLEPGKLTAAEIAVLRAKQEKVEKAISETISEQQALVESNPKWECSQTYQRADGTSYKGRRVTFGGKEYVAYSKVLADGSTQFYDCATNALLQTVAPQVIKGLGETKLEQKVISAQRKVYRTTELALVGAFLAGLFVVWRSD